VSPRLPMGLAGRLKFAEDPSRGNVSRRPPYRGPKIPAEVIEQAKEIYRREIELGNRYAAIEEARFAAVEQIGAVPVKKPSLALYAALKCWREALYTAYRIAGVAEPDEVDELKAYVGRRQKATQKSA
jgi:hypothetical protein